MTKSQAIDELRARQQDSIKLMTWCAETRPSYWAGYWLNRAQLQAKAIRRLGGLPLRIPDLMMPLIDWRLYFHRPGNCGCKG